MKIQQLSSDIAGIAKDAIDQVGETLVHGRDVVGESLEKGAHAIADVGGSSVSTMSGAIHEGSKKLGTLASLIGAYASLRTIASAMNGPFTGVLGALGLQRRRSTFATVMGATGLVVAGAAVGAGVALLVAPASGARTRESLNRRFRTIRRDAKGVVRDAEVAAKDVVHKVEDKARETVGSVRSAVGARNGTSA